MKKKNSIYTFIAGALLLVACNNDLPKFDDKDAYVAFTNTSMSVDENVESSTLDIPVLFTSLNGLETKVDFEIVDNTARQGINFELVNSNSTLQFTKDAPMQNITIRILDNDVFGGDVDFMIKLKQTEGTTLGAVQTCNIKIVDNEHPLAEILGTYTGAGESYFGGALSWTLTLEKDEDDVSTVWIGNLVPDGGNLKVYGVVNDDKTEIRIPVDQALVKDRAQLTGLDPETEDLMQAGTNIIGTIANGKITINNAMYGSGIFEDGKLSAFYEIVKNGSVWTKQ